MSLMTCNACGWVHFGVTFGNAATAVRTFNRFYDTAPKETKEQYGKRASMECYVKCSRCGGPYTNFRPAEDGDCPDGCTIGPILVEDEHD